MLNLAHMTLGTYPAGVPAPFRLKESSFKGLGMPSFKEVAIQLGVNVTGLSGGVCVEDFNKDGLLDIFTTSYGLTDQARLFRNTGSGFEEQTLLANLKGLFGGLNAIHADYNNDGWIDILILRGAWFGKGGKLPNSLLRNNGDGTFTDITIQAGLLSFHPTQTATWADFNNDGWLDLFIGNETTLTEGTTLVHPCEFYINQGDGSFKDVAPAIGMDVQAWVKSTVSADVNGDGWIDIFMSVPGEANKLFIHQGLDETGMPGFQESAAIAGVVQPVLGFPSWFFDANNDGAPDLFVGGYQFAETDNAGGLQFHEWKTGEVDVNNTSRLFLNDGNGKFKDVTETYGLLKSSFAMGSNFGDLNADGFLDFYLGTGSPDLRSLIPNRMFLNQSGESFAEITMDGFGHIQKGHGIAFGDIDNDGDEDIYCVMGGAYEGDLAQNILFENPGLNSSWITIQLEGNKSNRSAIGAHIKVTCVDADGQERSIHRWIGTGGSFGANSLQEEIGLGNSTTISSLQIDWPGNAGSQSFQDVELNRFVLIREGEEQVYYQDRPAGKLSE